MLSAFGHTERISDNRCDTTQVRGGTVVPLLLDIGTPLSVVFNRAHNNQSIVPQAQVLVYETKELMPSNVGNARVQLCGGPFLEIGSQSLMGRFRWGGDSLTEPELILGGGLFSGVSLGFTFGQNLQEPGCKESPCLKISSGSIATSCRLSDQGQAVIPFRLGGGGLTVEAGVDAITYPATRITLAACLEPLLLQESVNASPVSCLSCEKLEAAYELVAPKDCQGNRDEYCAAKGRADALVDLHSQMQCTWRIPPAPSGCQPCEAATDPNALKADLIDEHKLHKDPYLRHGVNARFLLSTALPGAILSSRTFLELHGGDQAAAQKQLATGLTHPLQFPGMQAPEEGTLVTLGRTAQNHLGLAVLSKEIHLSPCDELARNRRQRLGLPRSTNEDQAANQRPYCLLNQYRDEKAAPRRCGYEGQNVDLLRQACNDADAPVASLIELDTIQVYVVEDTFPLLRAANADIRSTGPQVQGILGIGFLERLQLEIDYPGNRLIATCNCEGEPALGKCRAFRRYTKNSADACTTDTEIRLPAHEPKAQQPTCG